MDSLSSECCEVRGELFRDMGPSKTVSSGPLDCWAEPERDAASSYSCSMLWMGKSWGREDGGRDVDLSDIALDSPARKSEKSWIDVYSIAKINGWCRCWTKPLNNAIATESVRISQDLGHQ